MGTWLGGRVALLPAFAVARRGPAAVCAQNPVTSAASCGSATVTALKCARSTETRPCGDAPRRGRLLLPSAAALPLGPLRRARPTWQPSALRGPGRRRGCGVRSAPRGALIVLRSCSAGSARRGCRGPPRPLAGPVRRPLEPGVLCACEADRGPPRGGPLSPRGWECWPQRPLAWFPGLPAQKWCAGRQQPGWRRLLEAVLVETRRKLAPRNEVPGRGGVWGTPWTVAPVQVTGPWERGAGG